MNSTEEVFIKIEYVKKLYAEQLKKLVKAQRDLHEKEIEIEIKDTEIQIKDEQIRTQDVGNVENLSTFKEQEAGQARMIVNMQHQMTELNTENVRVREQMGREYCEMEDTLKGKLLENQRLATVQNNQMQKALKKQKVDIELVMELNEKLKTNKERLEEKLAKLEADIRKEKEQRLAEVSKEKKHRSSILESLNETDLQKVRSSARLVTQDKEMDRMNMLYRQIASQKAALNHEKELVSGKLEKKK